MTTKIIGKYKVEFFDTIEEMPVPRYMEFNKYLLIDSGIGSSPEDIDRNIDKLAMYINSKDKENGLKQLMILKQGLYFAMNGQSSKLMSFACLINSINGEEVKYLSPDSLTEVINKLKNKLTMKIVSEIIDDLKKKLDNEMELYFPSFMDSAILKEYYEKIKIRAGLVLRQIIEGVDLTEDIMKIDTYLMSQVKPEVFHGKESKELKYQKEFEEMCFTLNQLTNKEAKSMTVMEFYTAFEMLKKQKPKKPTKHGR